MLDITLLTIGKIKDKYWKDSYNEYIKRLQPYMRLRVVEVEALSFNDSNKEQIKIKECEKLEGYIKNNNLDNVYLLSEEGKEFDSIELATWFNSNEQVCLVIAGSLGFSREMNNKYPTLSLSRLTFPHELARVILLEQLYRVISILNNKKYHY